MWEADCSRVGPGFLEDKVNGTKIPIECSPSDLYTITFTAVSVGLYTLEVTYNDHDTGLLTYMKSNAIAYSQLIIITCMTFTS